MFRMLILLACLALVIPAAARAKEGRDPMLGDARVFAPIPSPPGFPEAITVDDNTLYVTTQAHFGTAGLGPSEVVAYDLNSGHIIQRYVIQGEDLSQEHGLSGTAFDHKGRLYILSTQLGVVRLDPETGQQDIYATAFPQLFNPGPPPLPNDMVFDEAGNLYVTDSLQATIFRIPKGGGAPQVWFQDPRLGGFFGANGIRLDPTHTFFYVLETASGDNFGTPGGIYTLSLLDHPTAADLNLLHSFAYEGPDDIAIGQSGKIYVTLAISSQICVLNPDGTEVARYGGLIAPKHHNGAPIPYDTPSGIGFDRDTGYLLVNNHAELDMVAANMVVFRVFVDDTESPLIRPHIKG